MSKNNPNYVWTLYWYRWLVLLAYFFLNFFQCVATICISGFLSQEAAAFGQPAQVINLSNSSSALLFLPSFILATYLYNVMSMRKAPPSSAGGVIVSIRPTG